MAHHPAMAARGRELRQRRGTLAAAVRIPLRPAILRVHPQATRRAAEVVEVELIRQVVVAAAVRTTDSAS